MTAGPTTPSVGRVLTLPRPPGWLVGWWLVGRVVVFASAFAVHQSIWTLDLWDGRWYRLVASDGYLFVPGRPSDPAFFPLYPILLRAAHALGVGWGVVGPLVSDLAFFVALLLFHALSRELFGEKIARRATTLLAIFPLAYVFSMAYPESVVLALVLAAPLAATRGKWWLAAACAGAAGLGRPEALFLVLPLAGIAWQQRHSFDAVQRGVAASAVFAPVAGLLAYPLYLDSVLHDPLAWNQAEHAWHRSFSITGPYTAIAHLPHRVSAHPLFIRDARDVAFFVLYLGLLVAAWRLGTPRLWLVAAAAIVLLPVFSGDFTSVGRFGLLAPPLFWGLAWLTRRPAAERAVQAAFLVLLVLGTLSLAYVFP